MAWMLANILITHMNTQKCYWMLIEMQKLLLNLIYAQMFVYALMNVSLCYWSPFHANECVFSLNEEQKLYIYLMYIFLSTIQINIDIISNRRKYYSVSANLWNQCLTYSLPNLALVRWLMKELKKKEKKSGGVKPKPVIFCPLRSRCTLIYMCLIKRIYL